MANYKENICKLSGTVWKQYNSLQKCQCNECKKKQKPPNLKLKSLYVMPKQKKPINKVSKKKAILDAKYLVLRKEFLGKKENQICPITKQQTTEIHHTYSGKDRSKYYLEIDTWLAVSRQGHIWIHEFSKEARGLGYLK